MDRRNMYGLGVIFFIIILQVCNSVKITSLSTPDTVVIDDQNQEPIVLDCVYDISPNEKGFVLKWLLDGSPIYQWIPGRAPFALKSFKDRVDVSYEASPERNHKHRSLVITRPLSNFTGEYLCNVQTYESNDKQSKRIQFIHPESKFEVSYDNVEDTDVIVRCGVQGIAPKPNITLFIDQIKQHTIENSRSNGTDLLVDSIVHVRISRNLLHEGSRIACLLEIPGTGYAKEKDISYSNSASGSKLTTPATIIISILMFFISKL